MYSQTKVSTEIVIMLVGNLTLTVIFGIMIFAWYLMKKICGGGPIIIHKIFSSFGIAMALDIILLTIVDVAIQNSAG